MKILYLKLKNFASINVAMYSREIEIDFSCNTDKIIMISGPNGSGKTSILSCLHPFATNGNLDIRNDVPLVMKGKEGYKEIIILNDGIKYQIRHFFMPSKESHTVKSYITKDGLELNANGNVTSFKDIVKEELDIEMDFLKLTRLGANVTNFIDLKTTERKNFMGNILDDVDIYLEYFKKKSKDITYMKSVISHLIDKIDKLGISDIDEMKDKISNLEDELDSITQEHTKCKQQQAVVQKELNDLGDASNIRTLLNDALHDKQKIERLLSKKTDIELSIDTYQEQLVDIDNAISQCNIALSSEKTKRTLNIDNYNRLMNDEDALIQELEKLKASSQINDIDEMIKDVKKQIDARISQFNIIDFNPAYSKSDVEELIVLLKTNMEILISVYEMGRELVAKVVDMMVNKRNVEEFVSDRLTKSRNKRMSDSSELLLNRLTSKFPTSIPKCKNCGLYDFWKELYDIISEKPDDIEDSFDDEDYTYMKVCANTIAQVFNNLSNKKDLFQKFPLEIQSMFTVDKVFKAISECTYFYDVKFFNDELAKISEYELYLNDLSTISDLKSRKKALMEETSSIKFLNDRLTSVQSDISRYHDESDESNSIIEELENRLIKLTDDKELCLDLIDAINRKDEIDSIVNKYQDMYNRFDTLSKSSDKLMMSERSIKFNLDKITQEHQNCIFRLTQYKQYKKELKSYQEMYDESILIRNSLSAKEGIPLMYIQGHLESITGITNELLDIVYHGELYIKSFDLSADEFKIPYVKNGVEIVDVAHASDGERSFISLAISFALSYKSINKYNIMLLDEMDGMLDINNRSKFIEIVERLIEIIGAEQIFMISHNNMFDGYPVGTIYTGLDKLVFPNSIAINKK